ncbi:hypothetical protein ACEN8I_12650 [Polaromonas sp. CT11-55]|uniref:hypothetical protein n=1 Tax=Polaromonas sp. CT11-55 TaxID=3243045 RepID=UPI0039A74EC7
MLNKDPGHAAVKQELDHLAARFFRAVSFEAGEAPSYGDIHGLFIATGLLIKNTASTPEISSVAEFIAPRQALVDSGALTRFKEWELSQTTQIFGNIAHRYSAYGKAGTQGGKAFEARGVISTQFIKTPEGWKMSAMAWDDERPGLSLPAELLGG